jgi:SAM-dependent methyltransferase
MENMAQLSDAGKYYSGMTPEYYSRPTLVKLLLGKRIFSVVSGCIAGVTGKTVLELGCGTGRFTSLLAANNKVTALDSNPQLFRLEDVPFIAGNALELERLLSAGAKFDLIASFFMTDYLAPPEAAKLLRDCRRFLAPDGRLLFTFITSGLWGELYTLGARFLKGTRKYNYSPQEIDMMSSKAGFKIEYAMPIKRFGASLAVLVSLKTLK